MFRISGAKAETKCLAKSMYSAWRVEGICEGLPYLRKKQSKLALKGGVGNGLTHNVPVEESAKDRVCPLLCFPPFAPFPFFKVLRNSLFRKAQVDHCEQKLAPRHQAFGTLLMDTQVDHNSSTVCLENEMQHGRNILIGAGRLIDHLAGYRYQGGEQLCNQIWQNIALVTES